MIKKRHYQITEIAQSCQLSETIILQFIEKKWLIPADLEALELDDEDLARAKLIRELQRDLGVNDESIPIILHLLDQIHVLRNGFSPAR